MTKLFRAAALKVLDECTAWSGPDVARAYQKTLKSAFSRARSSKENVYVPFHIGGDIIRFEIKGAHLKKKKCGKHYAPYAKIIVVEPE